MNQEKWCARHKCPNAALGCNTLLSLLDTELGSTAVMNTLVRIEHGVFA
jgi:uncharacterized protein (DUF2384 family)